MKPYFSLEKLDLYHGDVSVLETFEKGFYDLCVTSPPYNLSIEYQGSDDFRAYDGYLNWCKNWLKNCYFWGKEQARLCLNVPLDTNKHGKQSLGADIIAIAKECGWKYQNTIIWNESNISRRTAWRSWLQASAPYAIAPVELVVVFYKNEYKRQKQTSTMSREEFLLYTNGLWSFSGESKKRLKHPAPFPRELPRRCIQLFSFLEDTIFDPFSGSGTTILEANALGRFSVGLEVEKEYCELSKKRILESLSLV
ncbi:site-specific DNA-methyltransferase [Helicobacter pylori]|nr:site-specific DNA-methyltransferase [Helicobacter pylori]